MKKILSDGTVARKGMIVVCLNGEKTRGNKTGNITVITKVGVVDDGWVVCRWMPEPDFPNLTEDDEMEEDCDYLRKATPEEKELFLKGNSHGKEER